MAQQGNGSYEMRYKLLSKLLKIVNRTSYVSVPRWPNTILISCISPSRDVRKKELKKDSEKTTEHANCPTKSIERTLHNCEGKKYFTTRRLFYNDLFVTIHQ